MHLRTEREALADVKEASGNIGIVMPPDLGYFAVVLAPYGERGVQMGTVRAIFANLPRSTVVESLRETADEIELEQAIEAATTPEPTTTPEPAHLQLVKEPA
jgi:hypothetical protein